MTNPNTAPVEQVDREAAAEAYDSIAGCTVPLNFGARVRKGEVSELAQAFARHRIATTAPLQARVEEMERALRTLIYEVTHLSPENADGSHDCRISREALSGARTALSTTPATSRLAELEAENARLREALRRIATGTYDGLEVDHYNASHCRRIARAALNGEG